MRRRTTVRTPHRLMLAAAALAFGPAAWADDIDTGRTKAQNCAVCHGPLGIAKYPGAPNLAGQPAIYLAAQLRAFRVGSRRSPEMEVMAKPLTNEDIDQIAAWYASIQVEATSSR